MQLAAFMHTPTSHNYTIIFGLRIVPERLVWNFTQIESPANPSRRKDHPHTYLRLIWRGAGQVAYATKELPLKTSARVRAQGPYTVDTYDFD